MCSRRIASLVYRALSTSIAAFLFVQSGYAQTTVVQMGRFGDPLMSPYPFYPGYSIYPDYWVSPCYPYVSCAAYQQQQIFERRQERFRQLRRETEQPAAGVQTNPGPAVNKAPSDVHQIQGEYQGASQPRPQYETSGEYLPEFLEGKVRPNRK